MMGLWHILANLRERLLIIPVMTNGLVAMDHICGSYAYVTYIILKPLVYSAPVEQEEIFMPNYSPLPHNL
jgi:hypothetical protein